MCPETSRSIRYLVLAIAIFATVIGWSSPSDAFVNQIVIDQTDTANYHSAYPAGQFDRRPRSMLYNLHWPHLWIA